MKLHSWLCGGIVALLLAGCASTQDGVSSEVRAAVAPTGKLRVAFLSPAPLYATKDPATGELKGVAVDLGKELAKRISVPFEPVGYTAVPALISGAKTGDWDVALLGINSERAAMMDFSAPYLEVEQGYLVRASAPIATASDVDKAGVRIGVLEKAGADVLLSRTLKDAVLVRVSSPTELYALIGAGKVDVIAATKTALFAEQAKLAGSRILEGRILVEPLGMGVPKGRGNEASAYVGKFVEEAKAEGLVNAAVERAGLRGVKVAPPK